MKKFLLILFFYQSFLISAGQIIQDKTKYYSFEVNYWFNMHHFLWLESFMNVSQDSSIIDRQLSEVDHEKLKVALRYYGDNLLEYDLRESDYVSEFKVWITDQNTDLEDIPTRFQSHFKILQGVSGVYRDSFWPDHRETCQTVLRENIELIRRTEERFVASITKLTRQFWQEDKIKVDITFVAKSTNWNLRNRPYTTIFPTHVVMNAVGENDYKGNWLELLYHESAHHLILGSSYFVGGTIKDFCEISNVKPPRQLGHSYLFYFTGELTKQLLASEGVDYELSYMQRNSVFSRYYPFLDIHLKSYMSRDITLTEATDRIISNLNQ